jgi:AraC-like DNA-binding protein
MVETAKRVHLSAPPTAIWIPAGTKHATTVSSAPLHSLFFSPKSYSTPTNDIRTFRISPLLKEMICVATAGLTGSSQYKQSFFLVLHELMSQAFKQPSWPSLARPTSAELTRAVAFLLANLDSATPALLATQAGASERTLRRLFQAEFGTTAQTYIQHARLIKAMHLLSHENHLSVTEIALAVGYANHSAFTSAFRQFTGTTPTDFRNSATATTSHK